MADKLPKTLGGLAPKVWQQIKKETKLKKDEDLEKNLAKVDTELGALSDTSDVKALDSLKKHILKASLSASKVMKQSKVSLIVAFCHSVIDQFGRYEKVLSDRIERANRAASNSERPDAELIAAAFAVAKSKFPSNKAVKAFCNDKQFIMFPLGGKKTSKLPYAETIQKDVRKQLAGAVKGYVEFEKLSKKKPASTGETIGKLDAICADLLTTLRGISTLINSWFNQVSLVQGEDSEYKKAQDTPIWQIARLAQNAVKSEYERVSKIKAGWGFISFG
jgi:hypothetical protein